MLEAEWDHPNTPNIVTMIVWLARLYANKLIDCVVVSVTKSLSSILMPAYQLM
jgi:hypothetical protein